MTRWKIGGAFFSPKGSTFHSKWRAPLTEMGITNAVMGILDSSMGI